MLSRHRSFISRQHQDMNIWAGVICSSVEKVIKKHSLEFDIIHAHFTWSAGYVGSQLKETYAVPFIHHGSRDGHLRSAVQKRVLYRADNPYPEFRRSYHHRQPE